MSANIIFYTEAPGVESSHLGGTTIESFDSLTPGALGSYTSAIGTYSPGAQVMAPDIFGGANLTSYIAVGAESGALSYTLTFTSPQSFFGFYWQAIDAANLVQFYNGSQLVAAFSASNITAGLSSAYLGDPNTSTDATEMYAFVGFLSDNTATNFNQVTFSNLDPGTGFESDNHTILAGSSAPTPEPATYATVVPVLAGIAVAARRRRKVACE
jgi:hypothetical protein